jgi:hypothetical protein
MSLFLLVDAFKKTLKDICRKKIDGYKLVFMSFTYCKRFQVARPSLAAILKITKLDSPL